MKFFDDARGFGFIVPEVRGADVFVHFSAIEMQGRRTLLEGDRVEFDVVEGEKGPAAQSVVVLAPCSEVNVRT